MITTRRTLDELRALFPRRWVRRITTIHAESGRYLLEPRSGWLALSLQKAQPERWWDHNHQQAALDFFNGRRRDRMRRLPGQAARADRFGEGACALDLALRLEALSVTPRADKHWRGVGESFDELWKTTRLLTVSFSPMLKESFSYLQRLQSQVLSWEQTDRIPAIEAGEGAHRPFR